MSKKRSKSLVAKFAALILRHKPDKYGITIDSHGYANLNDLLGIIATERGLGRGEILEALRKDKKDRFVIENDKIACRYGHSFDVKPLSKPAEPPAFLYHGTSHSVKQKIETEGLKPMCRQFVHLSKTIEEAKIVGKRKEKDREPLIIRISAKDAYQEGIKFYDAGPLFLAQEIPGKFLSFDF